MPDVLNQKEVDALLAAAAQGEIEPGASVPPAAKVEGDIQPYDFTRPERVNKEQIRTLTALHESFARNVAANLSGVMRRVVQTELSSVEQLTYGEFIQLLPNPTCLLVLSARPLEGKVALELDPSIVFPMLDRLLGGTGEDMTVPERPITDIESRLVMKIVAPVLELLKEMWSNIKAIDFVVAEIQANPQLLQAAPPHDPVVLVKFRLNMGATSGFINLCLPCATLEPVMGLFTAQQWLAAPHKPGHEADQTQIARSIAGAQLGISADLAVTQITVRELLELEVGDLIKTDADVDSEAIVYVEGKPKFKGRAGRNKRNKAIVITRPLEPEGPV